MFSPLETFEIHVYTQYLSNFSCLILVTLIISFFLFRTSKFKLIPAKFQSILELFTDNLSVLVKDNASNFGVKFTPFLITLFTLFFLWNFLGLLPLVYPITAQISITFGFSLSIWIGITLIGFNKYGINFMSIFLPLGAPIWLAPLLVLIEVLSYIARAISLGVRLAANVTSGHILLNIISGFVIKIIFAGSLFLIISLFPLVLLVLLIGLELAVAIVQAYVFTLLTAIYIKDGLILH